jgi:hypothetical protein
VVGELDVAVVEKEDPPMPLADHVPVRLTERRLRRSERPLVVEPSADLVDDRFAARLSSRETLFGGVACLGGIFVDGEERAIRMTSMYWQLEESTVFISAPQSGQIRISGGTGFSIVTRGSWAGAFVRPPEPLLPPVFFFGGIGHCATNGSTS